MAAKVTPRKRFALSWWLLTVILKTKLLIVVTNNNNHGNYVTVTALSSRQQQPHLHHPEKRRRTILFAPITGSLVINNWITVGSHPALAFDKIAGNDDASLLSWSSDLPSFSKCRYRTSTLSSPEGNRNVPAASDSPVFYPSWMEGYWSIQYKFSGASFPQGRKVLSIRTAGAGLGTCLTLPNVGYNPPAPHAVKFLSSPTEESLLVYEDLAYNIPRRLESFWPQSKVTAVQTASRGGLDSLTPKCFVTGEGCLSKENPYLHNPSTRFVMDFDAPTRRSGRQTQTWDTTLLSTLTTSNINNQDPKRFVSIQSYSQFNPNQEIQTFYKQRLSLELVKDGNDNSDETSIVTGTTNVAAFLPKYIRELDNNNLPVTDSAAQYDENQAVATYDYKFVMKSIDENEALSL